MNNKIYLEIFVRKSTGMYWNKVSFTDEQFEELSGFLNDMFEGEKDNFDFPVEEEDFTIKPSNNKV